MTKKIDPNGFFPIAGLLIGDEQKQMSRILIFSKDAMGMFNGSKLKSKLTSLLAYKSVNSMIFDGLV